MINLDQLRAHFEFDEHFFDKSRALMLGLKAQIMEELVQACREGDGEKVCATAHNLKGMICNFFADDLIKLLHEIELSGRTNRKIEFTHLERLLQLDQVFEREIRKVRMRR